MTKTIPTRQDAIEKLCQITDTLLKRELDFTLVTKREKKTITITCVKHCDSVIAFIPEFVLDFENGQRFARLILRYE